MIRVRLRALALTLIFVSALGNFQQMMIAFSRITLWYTVQLYVPFSLYQNNTCEPQFT